MSSGNFIKTCRPLDPDDMRKTRPVRVMERSIHSARYCFVENLKNSSVLTEFEYILLNEWFKETMKMSDGHVDLIVYLRTSPEVCYQRIKRRNRPEEQNITLTTIAAVEFDGGVIIGADSRTTSGAYIANRVTDKLTKVTDYIYCCRSGSAADTQAVADIVNYHLNFYKMEMGEEPLVKTAASVFRTLCYNNRDSLSAGILVAGWDKRNGGQVYTIPLGGMWTRMPVAIGGSGSTYLYGYADANYKPGMSKDECLKFIANAISLAINRDGSSGGVIRLACITKDGVERHVLTGDQLPKFYEDS